LITLDESLGILRTVPRQFLLRNYWVVGYYFGVLSLGCSHLHVLIGSDLSAVSAELTLKVLSITVSRSAWKEVSIIGNGGAQKCWTFSSFT